MRGLATLWTAAAAAAALCGCGGGDGTPTPTAAPLPTTAPGVGPGAPFRPPSLNRRTARDAKPIGGLRCARRAGRRYGVHLELFAHGKVVLVPPGIGIAPPREARGAYVRGGRCSYPLRTREPTGVIEVTPEQRTPTLGRLFAIWGQPLGRDALASFHGRVSAYVDGRSRMRDPRAIRLKRHAQIVLEVNGYVRPHASYRFPPGL